MAIKTNVGRVQGAGVFFSTATSGTSVDLTAITPSTITPLVGDAVLFGNGDLRLVASVSETTISLGEVQANFKGA